MVLNTFLWNCCQSFFTDLKATDPVYIIGHPVGLPKKLAEGAKVRDVTRKANCFIADLDTFAGNSG